MDTWVRNLEAGDREVLKKTRRSLVLTRDALAGELITPEVINYKRPGYGVTPEFTEMVVGKRLKRDVPSDTPLEWQDLTDGG